MKKRIIALILALVLVLSVAAASAATYYRVNTSHLKVHQFDDEKSQVVASREKDFAMTVVKKVGNWWYVKFTNGNEGYVQKKYVTSNSSYAAWVDSDGTNLRKGPGYDYANVGTLAKGAKVTVLTSGSTYCYVKSSIGYGYVHKGYLSRKKVKASGNASTPAFVPASNYTAYISNGTRSVNLRSAASTNAPVVQEYPTGTQVTVISHGETWDEVQIGSSHGYMMTNFLTTTAPAPVPVTPSVTPATYTPYTAYVTSDNKKGVNVRNGAGTGYTYQFTVPYGASVTVVEHGKDWDKITWGTRGGYMMNKFLTLNKPEDVVNPPDPPTPVVVTYPYNAVTTCTEGEKVNMRSKPWKTATAMYRLDPGTAVKVVGVAKINGKTYGGWVKVEYNGATGYMMEAFLKK